jgi:Na+-transporting NADH:ubiquinone oxidoreductase subunit C
MVIIVAVLLSFVSMQLKPRQKKNEEIEQMKNILASVNIESTAQNAEKLFKQYITNSYVINIQGKKQENKQSFDIDLKKETAKIGSVNSLKSKLVEPKKSPFKKFMAGFVKPKEINTSAINNEILKIKEEIKLPVYICEQDNKSYYVFAIRGKGLWGPIWGYISLEDDFNTVHGAYFDHKSETPGLGAEIKTKAFQDQFKGKMLFDTKGNFVSIKVMKGKTSGSNLHGVDAISGGTITSKGVEKMLFDWLSVYNTFIKNQTN